MLLGRALIFYNFFFLFFFLSLLSLFLLFFFSSFVSSSSSSSSFFCSLYSSFFLLMHILFLLHLLVCYRCLYDCLHSPHSVHRLSGSCLLFGCSPPTGFSWPLSIGRSGCCPAIGFFRPPLLQSMLFGHYGRSSSRLNRSGLFSAIPTTVGVAPTAAFLPFRSL